MVTAGKSIGGADDMNDVVVISPAPEGVGLGRREQVCSRRPQGQETMDRGPISWALTTYVLILPQHRAVRRAADLSQASQTKTR